jgi:hypothetical protein
MRSYHCHHQSIVVLTFLYAALESIRINLFSSNPEQERRKLNEEGFSFKIPDKLLKTPKKVIEELKCSSM